MEELDERMELSCCLVLHLPPRAQNGTVFVKPPTKSNLPLSCSCNMNVSRGEDEDGGGGIASITANKCTDQHNTAATPTILDRNSRWTGLILPHDAGMICARRRSWLSSMVESTVVGVERWSPWCSVMTTERADSAGRRAHLQWGFIICVCIRTETQLSSSIEKGKRTNGWLWTNHIIRSTTSNHLKAFVDGDSQCRAMMILIHLKCELSSYTCF